MMMSAGSNDEQPPAHIEPQTEEKQVKDGTDASPDEEDGKKESRKRKKSKGTNEISDARRESHKLIEQKRRQKINEKINELRELLNYPGSQNKAVVLQAAVENIKNLKLMCNRLLSHNRQLQDEYMQIASENERLRKLTNLPPSNRTAPPALSSTTTTTTPSSSANNNNSSPSTSTGSEKNPEVSTHLPLKNPSLSGFDLLRLPPNVVDMGVFYPDEQSQSQQQPTVSVPMLPQYLYPPPRLYQHQLPTSLPLPSNMPSGVTNPPSIPPSSLLPANFVPPFLPPESMPQHPTQHMEHTTQTPNPSSEQGENARAISRILFEQQQQQQQQK